MTTRKSNSAGNAGKTNSIHSLHVTNYHVYSHEKLLVAFKQHDSNLLCTQQIFKRNWNSFGVWNAIPFKKLCEISINWFKISI